MKSAFGDVADRTFVIPKARWLLAPIPKVASTVLKRLAVIASDREPQSIASLGETRPALAIHRSDVHGLEILSSMPHEQQDQWYSDPHVLRLAVTRHPGERLLSFWHDKLHLADPAYIPLNISVQSSRNRDRLIPCRFCDFLFFVDEHWEQLKADAHLMPQQEWLGDKSLFNKYLDRGQLVENLPALLAPFLTPECKLRIDYELKLYAQQFRQRLTKRWGDSYSKDGLEIIERRYGIDLDAFGYALPKRPRDRVKPLASVDLDALVDPLQQLRDRHQQIAGLQDKVLELQQQLSIAHQAFVSPSLPTICSETGQWPAHNDPGSGLSHLYEALSKQCFKEVLDQTLCLEGHPHFGEVSYLKGLAQNCLGFHDLALRSFEEAQSAGFLTPYVLFNGGNACRSLGHIEDGLRLYREALQLFPRFTECRHNFALALIENSQFEEAERELRLLLLDQPSYFHAAFCLGNLLRDRKRELEAIEAFRLCLYFAPHYADAWNNLGLIYGCLKKTDDAIACYRHALSIDASFKPSRQNLAQALVQIKDHSQAFDEFSRFCSLNTLTTQERVVGLQGKISCLMELGRHQEGLDVATTSSDDRRVQLMARLHVLPVLYESDAEVFAVRRRWTRDAEELYQLLENPLENDANWELLYAHAWSLTNFYLAYQMQDDRPLQELYAGILDRIVRPRLNSYMQPRPKRKSQNRSPIRLGVISPHLINHNGSIWALGWLQGIAGSANYELFCYNIGDSEDSGSRRFAEIANYRHLPLRADNAEQMLQRILDDDLDILIFTDIGMHPASKITSILRLAPVQIQGWGHPVTSGSTTMDYFFSGAGMEADGNESHYTEILFRLPRTGLNYETPASIHDGQILYDKYNLPRDRPIINSLQSMFKYLPWNDSIFADIAKNCPEVFIVMVGHMGYGGIADRLFERLRPHFISRGLLIEDHLRILPRLDYGDYMGLFSICHHTIDTIDWNGGNSSFQSLSLGCPVVTLPTPFMRGRHTVSMLQVLGLPELVAKDRKDYVAISARLLQDRSFCEDIRSKISDRKHLLFHDIEVAKVFKLSLESIYHGAGVSL